MQTSEEKHIYTSIQVLRGVAALAIVFFHISEMLNRYSDKSGLFCSASSLWETGAFGVDLFFIISGFVMMESTGHMFQQKGAPLTFFTRRLIRIMPLYWLYTLLILILVLLPYTLQSTVFSSTYTVKSFLLIPALNPVTNLPLPLLPQGWTLWYEMYFYALFTILLVFDKKLLIPAISLFFAGSIITGFMIHTSNPLVEVITNPLLLEFALGCILAQQVQRYRLSTRASIYCISTGFFLLFMTQYLKSAVDLRIVVWGGPAFLITLGFVHLERRTSFQLPKICIRLGDSSFSLYLSHIFILLAMSTLLKTNMISPVIGNDFIAITSAILCIACGWLSYVLIEAKSQVFLRSKFQTKKYISPE